MRLLVVGLVVVLVACTEPDDPCGAAADHVAACTGDSAAAGGATCDPERAESILAMNCNDLAAAAAAGKVDGWWGDFMCSLGFTSYCSGSSATPTARTLTGNVYKLGTTNEAANHVYVRATREGSSETRGSWTVGGVFAITNLPPARYRVEVALTTTSAALTSKTVDVASQSFVVLYAPVP